jgi:multiple sugar transport system permease protein
MFVQILIPIILPGILTAGVFAFIGAWNELFSALCLMKHPSP